MEVINDPAVANKLVSRLKTYIDSFEFSGTPFEKIFNNDKIKYDCYDNNFFCFKMHGDHHRTFRLLYRFVRKAIGYDIEPHMIILKRDTNKSKREYLDQFEKYAKSYKENKDLVMSE